MATLKQGKNCETCEVRKENVFCDIPKAGIAVLNESKITNVFKRGHYVFYEGNFPSGLYCVNGGVVKLETSGPNGHNHILRMVHAGGMLGYRSLFSEEPYRASALVHEEATICFIPKGAIIRLIETYPNVAIHFLSRVSRELRQAEGRFCGLTDKNAGERIAESLLFLKDNFPEQIWTRKEIAEWAGTTPETVMRTLSEFEETGLIEQTGRIIKLKNKSALIEMANLTL